LSATQMKACADEVINGGITGSVRVMRGAE
jgi:hypothetical protein